MIMIHPAFLLGLDALAALVDSEEEGIKQLT